jgi:hypothetical protein
MTRESSTTRAVRREYEQIKRLYHKVGKKATSKPEHSQVKRDYAEVKKEYNRLGRKLGRLTKKRPRS